MFKPLFLSFLTCFSFSLCSYGQDSTERKLIGKWGICYNLDTVDLICNNPFNFYILNPNGKYIGRDIIIMNEKVPVIGIWKFENGSVKIVTDNSKYYSFPPETFNDIIFINNDFFYYKVLDKKESPGHWVYYSFKRLK